jgi:3-hydroxyisobutyrate dehydrogenase
MSENLDAGPSAIGTENKVAVLGTGTLGAPMARNIAAAGIEVAAWNRSEGRAAALADHGVRVCPSATDAVRGAGLVVTILSDAAAVTEVMDDVSRQGGMEPGAIWIQSSTVGVDDTARFAQLARAAGAAFVDAPVLGTRTPAERGQLVVLASGPEAARGRCAPVFDAIGRRTLWLGSAGTGTRLKLVVNTWLLSLVEVLAETVAFTKVMGLEPETFFSTIEQGGVSLPYVRLKGEAMVREEFPPDFTLDLARKDIRLVLDAAGAADLPLPVVQTVIQQFDRAIELGHGGRDYAATYLVSGRRA